jgi:cell division protein FtsW
MDFRRWNQPAVAFLLMGGATILVFIGVVMDGQAHRWIRLGVAQLQPSEIAKPALILFCAYFIARRAKAINDRHTVLPASVAVGILGGAVVFGDLGTAVVLVMTAVLLFFVAGLQWRYIGIAVAIACLGLVLAIAMKPYRVFRVIGFVDPELKIVRTINPEWADDYEAQNKKSGRDAGYQVKQSVVAIGTGGLTGVGLMEGKQKLLYLPEAHTDFIFAVIGERYGFIGACLLLALYGLLLWRAVRIATLSRDMYGSIMAGGVAVMFLFQMFVNIGMTVGIMPVTGIPLPFVSYGGAAMITFLMMVGLLQSIHVRATADPRETRARP